MAKQRRGRDPGERAPEPARPAVEGPRPAVEPELAREQAPARATERLAALASAPEPPGRLAERVGLALRVAPKDPAVTGRLVDLVARSGLPPERRQGIVERLEGDQRVADRVAAAVTLRLGRDDEALRAELVRAFDAAAIALAEGQGAEREVAAEVSARTGIEPAAIEGLCRDVGLLLALWFEEEEETAPPGDYAAEESGF